MSHVPMEVIDISDADEPGDPPEPQAKIGDRESSTKFTQGIINARGDMELHRHRPWFKVIPVRTLLVTFYRSLSSSTGMQPFHLVGLGNILLGFVKNLSTSNENATSTTASRQPLKRETDRDLDKYLEILETIFVRLTSFEEERRGADSKQFMDAVWELHTNGTLDLSKTTIPGIMVKSCPSRLDNHLRSYIGSDVGSTSSALFPLCDRSPDNFLRVMQFLRTRYSDTTPDSGGHQTTAVFLEIGCRLQKDLRENLGCQILGEDGYASLFPSPFHPLLRVLSEILRCPWSETVFQNEAVIEELCNLVNKLSHEAELTRINPSDVIFILRTIPDLPCDAIFEKASVKYNGNLWLKRSLKRSELSLPIRVL